MNIYQIKKINFPPDDVMQACEQSNGYWCSDNAQPYVQRPPPLGIQIQVLKHTNTNTYKSQVQINTDVVIKSSHLSNLPFPLWMHGRPMFKNHPWEIVNKILSLNHFFTFCMLQNQQLKKKCSRWTNSKLLPGLLLPSSQSQHLSVFLIAAITQSSHGRIPAHQRPLLWLSRRAKSLANPSFGRWWLPWSGDSQTHPLFVLRPTAFKEALMPPLLSLWPDHHRHRVPSSFSIALKYQPSMLCVILWDIQHHGYQEANGSLILDHSGWPPWCGLTPAISRITTWYCAHLIQPSTTFFYYIIFYITMHLSNHLDTSFSHL